MNVSEGKPSRGFPAGPGLPGRAAEGAASQGKGTAGPAGNSWELGVGFSWEFIPDFWAKTEGYSGCGKGTGRGTIPVLSWGAGTIPSSAGCGVGSRNQGIIRESSGNRGILAWFGLEGPQSPSSAILPLSRDDPCTSLPAQHIPWAVPSSSPSLREPRRSRPAPGPASSWDGEFQLLPVPGWDSGWEWCGKRTPGRGLSKVKDSFFPFFWVSGSASEAVPKRNQDR